MGVVTATLTSDGQTMDPAWQVLSIDILREVGRIPWAELVLVDGDTAQRRFALSDDGFFDPAKRIAIKLRYENDPGSEQTVFGGLVVGQAVGAGRTGSTLTVTLKDAAVKLAQVPKSAVFSQETDDAVAKNMLEAAGLKAGDIAATQAVHPEIVQYACTDWDFLVSRADVNGLLVCVEDGVVSWRKIAPPATPVRTFEYGLDPVFALALEAQAEGQYGEVSSTAWDAKNQAMTTASPAQDASLSPGDLDASSLADALGGAARVLTQPAPVVAEELQAWADATLARSRLGLVRGRISVPGFAGLKLLDAIEIKGVGKHFNGKAQVTGWRHRVTEQGWITDLKLGLAADWFADRPGVAARRASGLLPPVGGLHVGVVDGYADDPDQEFRIKVRVPALGEGQAPLWARLAAPDAGQGRGFFCRPEPGDEVVLGFFNEDPRLPVIIGALFGSAHTPPEGFEQVSEQNNLKGWITKSGTRIAFDDQDRGQAKLAIETANHNKILLDDAAKSIQVEDQHGNRIVLDQNGITLATAKDLKLQADGKVEIQGSAVDVK
ncbi:Rhs element Vgr protein [Methylomagnum ishizawai]|uniref:Rhs element Vgr protein n=1 Tax=Methylomagnum ishizawai TaxID=1760988 RepID=A0A1Y6DE18_9GAMM|nr:type VI secretion system tip protein VgrG [Methylomagnum ishizawai]SMF97695.1 Rhs element Vgr protein [Methylomagnum ishizawai]